jgi:hypothetical protein
MKMGVFADATTSPANGLVSLESSFPVKGTVDRLARRVQSKGLKGTAASPVTAMRAAVAQGAAVP